MKGDGAAVSLRIVYRFMSNKVCGILIDKSSEEAIDIPDGLDEYKDNLSLPAQEENSKYFRIKM